MVKFGGIDNYVVVTWTKEDMETCLDLNLPCADASVYLPADPYLVKTEMNAKIKSTSNSTAAGTSAGTTHATNNIDDSSTTQLEPPVPEFATKSYNRIMWMKPAVVKVLLELGYAVHSTDIDLAYAAKPVWESYLSYLELNMDGIVADAAFQAETGVYTPTVSPINSGNFLALPTPATLALFSTWVSLVNDHLRTGGNQHGLARLFEGGQFLTCQGEEQCTHMVHSRDKGNIKHSTKLMNLTIENKDGTETLFQPNFTSFDAIRPSNIAVVRTYNPPWWSEDPGSRNYCTFNGDTPPPPLDPCASSLLYLHPICTFDAKRMISKRDVLRYAGFWFMEYEEGQGCPVGDAALADLTDTGDDGSSDFKRTAARNRNAGETDNRVVERCIPAGLRGNPGSQQSLIATTKCQPHLAFAS